MPVYKTFWDTTYRFKNAAHRDSCRLLAEDDQNEGKEAHMEQLKKKNRRKYYEIGLHYEDHDHKLYHESLVRNGAVVVTSPDE
jgi:hypothetical protein